mmetsp:Transcript_57263/g.166138  ORF Transcript_57263/g.166138 Transcript_57263/m.166138 type:complete len:266 (-) Transcript_57263:71-868(-)
MGAAQSTDEQAAEKTKSKRTRSISFDEEEEGEAQHDSRSQSRSSSASDDGGGDVFEHKSGLLDLPKASAIADSLRNASPLMLHSTPGGSKGLSYVSAPAGGWSAFTAQEARGRVQDALKTEVEYILKCIAWESDHGRTCMNIYCANQERCELIVGELRQRMFTVLNPVRNWYAAKAKELFQMRGRIPMPPIPPGVDVEEYLLRMLYADPLAAEAQFSHYVGTFKIFVHVSLDVQTESGHAYYFGAELPTYQQHSRDSRLLLRVSW